MVLFQKCYIKLVPKKQQHSPLIWASLFVCKLRLKFIYMKARRENSGAEGKKKPENKTKTPNKAEGSQNQKWPPPRTSILYYQNLRHNKIKSLTFTPSSFSLLSPTLMKWLSFS